VQVVVVDTLAAAPASIKNPKIWAVVVAALDLAVAQHLLL
jgi:hypothetical protein